MLLLGDSSSLALERASSASFSASIVSRRRTFMRRSRLSCSIWVWSRPQLNRVAEPCSYEPDSNRLESYSPPEAFFSARSYLLPDPPPPAARDRFSCSSLVAQFRAFALGVDELAGELRVTAAAPSATTDASGGGQLFASFLLALEGRLLHLTLGQLLLQARGAILGGLLVTPQLVDRVLGSVQPLSQHAPLVFAVRERLLDLLQLILPQGKRVALVGVVPLQAGYFTAQLRLRDGGSLQTLLQLVADRAVPFLHGHLQPLYVTLECNTLQIQLRGASLGARQLILQVALVRLEPGPSLTALFQPLLQMRLLLAGAAQRLLQLGRLLPHRGQLVRLLTQRFLHRLQGACFLRQPGLQVGFVLVNGPVVLLQLVDLRLETQLGVTALLQLLPGGAQLHLEVVPFALDVRDLLHQRADTLANHLRIDVDQHVVTGETARLVSTMLMMMMMVVVMMMMGWIVISSLRATSPGRAVTPGWAHQPVREADGPIHLNASDPPQRVPDRAELVFHLLLLGLQLDELLVERPYPTLRTAQPGLQLLYLLGGIGQTNLQVVLLVFEAFFTPAALLHAGAQLLLALVEPVLVLDHLLVLLVKRFQVHLERLELFLQLETLQPLAYGQLLRVQIEARLFCTDQLLLQRSQIGSLVAGLSPKFAAFVVELCNGCFQLPNFLVKVFIGTCSLFQSRMQVVPFARHAIQLEF
uniref:Uncharacterized protein n=1 Tax=Anopheles atroparvus TaxID=41427 RepID=A0A182JKW7_ANOAO